MTLDPEEGVMEAGPARYGAVAQGNMETPDTIIPSVFDPALPDDRYPAFTPRRPIHEIMDDIITYRQERDRIVSKLDHLNFELSGANGPREEAMDRDDWSPTGTKTGAANPPTALTADQQITLRCMEIVGQEMSSASLSPKGRKLFRDTVDELIARVTTGNRPDTNGTKE